MKEKMDAANQIEQEAVRMIIDKGVKYKLSFRKKIMLKPLKFGTVLLICEELCKANLTLQKIEEGNENLPEFILNFGEMMLRVIAIASLNSKKCIGGKRIVSSRANYLKIWSGINITFQNLHLIII